MVERFAEFGTTIDAPRNKLRFLSDDQNASQRYKSETPYTYRIRQLQNLRYVKYKLPDVDGMIILRWIFRKLEGVVGTGWSWLRIVTGGGHL
jgi:hypothetical protein